MKRHKSLRWNVITPTSVSSFSRHILRILLNFIVSWINIMLCDVTCMLCYIIVTSNTATCKTVQWRLYSLLWEETRDTRKVYVAGLYWLWEWLKKQPHQVVVKNLHFQALLLIEITWCLLVKPFLTPHNHWKQFEQ